MLKIPTYYIWPWHNSHVWVKNIFEKKNKKNLGRSSQGWASTNKNVKFCACMDSAVIKFIVCLILFSK